MMMMLEAIRAVNAGMAVFPVEPNAKTPIRIHQDKTAEESPYTVRWSEIATTDINTVIDWWTYAPSANIGIACKPSGLFIVDCDQPKRDYQLKDTEWSYLHDLLGPKVDGETLFDQVAERFGGAASLADVFDTYTVTTGSGGRHFYYRWPTDVQSTQDSIVKGIVDVRGNGGERGGYVLGPGSATDKGVYCVSLRRPVRDAPNWLIRLCEARERTTARAPDSPYSQPRHVSLGGLVDSVRFAMPGNRNNVLLWAARAMCADGATQEKCEELLLPAGAESGQLDRDIRNTIRSAYRLQQRKA